MISSEEALEYLFDESNYNFRHFLQEVSSGNSTENTQVPLIINTVELFAFGNLAHYIKYKQHYVELPQQGVEKLMKLTLVSFCNEYEGTSVPIDELLLALHIEELEVHQETLEQLIMSMVDTKLISALVDEKQRSVTFQASYVQRDAYNSSTYKLRVLTEEDVNKRSVTRAKAILQRWVDEYIAPTREQLQHSS